MKKSLFADKDNLVFVDTEFSSFDPSIGKVLAVGMVKPDGSNLYIEIDHKGECSDWVKENILPNLIEPKIAIEKARELISDFIGPEKLRPVFLVPQYDMVYLMNKFFDQKSFPMLWLPIDVASIIFASGIKPESFMKGDEAYEDFCKLIDINPEDYQEHNALSDAKLCRDIYYRLIKKRYHTHEELLSHRYHLYIFFLKLLKQVKGDCIWRSKLHHDGTMLENSFVLGAVGKDAKQMTYHLPMRLWEKTDFVQTLECAPPWDGHSSEDVLLRFEEFIADLS